MIVATSNKRKNNIYLPIFIAISLHLGLFTILVCGTLFSQRTLSIAGDNSIKAMMIDLSAIAAPELSLVEDTPYVERSEEMPVVESPEPDITQEEIKEDLNVATKIIEKQKITQESRLAIKKKSAKSKEKHKNPLLKQKFSAPQVKQEIVTEQRANTVIATSISENRQFSMIPTPISRNQPEYPRRALDMRIEGYVIVLYDINHSGRVENIRIIEAKPSNIFNRTVIQAMKQWKYQPIKRKDLTIKIVFNRDKSIRLDNT